MISSASSNVTGLDEGFATNSSGLMQVFHSGDIECCDLHSDTLVVMVLRVLTTCAQ